MEHSNNPENQKPNVPHDLGQITETPYKTTAYVSRETDEMPPYRCLFCGMSSWIDPSDQTAPPDYCHESDHGTPDNDSEGKTATAHNPKPWVVVEFAGMENEDIGADFATFKEAAKNIADWYGEDEIEEMNVRIMRRLDDGTLTTEF